MYIKPAKMFLKHTILFSLIIQLWLPHIFCQNDSKDCVSCSVKSMEKLLKIERQAVSSLKDYIKKLENKIAILGSLKSLFEENEKFDDDGGAYELRAFSLIHRLHFDWYDWESFFEQSVGTAEVENLELHLSKMPSNWDFSEAVQSLIRLQKNHFITANDMTSGLLRGKQYDAKLSALDSFAIARNMFNRSKFQEAVEWAEEALRLYEKNILNDLFESSLEDINAVYAETQQKLGINSTKALTAMKKALLLDSLKTKLELLNNKMKLDKNSKENESFGSEVYSKMSCHNGFPQKISNLHCHLYDKTNAFLKIAPFKMEELSVDPYVVKFYDIISDMEIIHLKEISQKSLFFKPLTIKDYSDIDDTRTSKVAWLPDNATKIVININERISDMTGFDLENSEQLQVMNYGMAGQYLYHFDHFLGGLNDTIDGDRIATVLIYLNDIVDGGETMFPEIGLVAKPEKGTALVWYNLDDKGDSDMNVGHIACPVIVGSKWAMTKWIRERAQFRARPCLPIEKQ